MVEAIVAGLTFLPGFCVGSYRGVVSGDRWSDIRSIFGGFVGASGLFFLSTGCDVVLPRTETRLTVKPVFKSHRLAALAGFSTPGLGSAVAGFFVASVAVSVSTFARNGLHPRQNSIDKRAAAEPAGRSQDARPK